MSKVMFCIDLNEHSFNRMLAEVKGMGTSNITELYLVHGFTQQLFADNFLISSFPAQDQYDEVKKSVIQFLGDFEDKLPESFSKVKIIKECVIAPNPKAALTEYAKLKGIDIMYIVTRGVHGVATLFNSSFAEYMIRHAHCELRILRNLSKD